jgi:hypothetical protein
LTLSEYPIRNFSKREVFNLPDCVELSVTPLLRHGSRVKNQSPLMLATAGAGERTLWLNSEFAQNIGLVAISGRYPLGSPALR